EDLSFYTIPAVLASWSTPTIVRQLNLFINQLYTRTYEEFITKPNRSQRCQLDRFLAPIYPFTISPVTFLRIFMVLRRKGQSFTTLYFGRILHSELIAREDF
ncbi:hypothetical protein DL98DRAFT_436193, partial [Cadophora sp. DSE1049]